MSQVRVAGHVVVRCLRVRARLWFAAILIALLLPHSVPTRQPDATVLDGVHQARDQAARFMDIPSEADDLLFEENLGQWDPHLNFISRTDGYTAYLGSGDLSLAFGEGVSAQMSYVDANPQAIAMGVGDGLAKTHYLIGNSREAWHPNVPSYTQVRYEELYPGIDLLYSGNNGLIQYDFIIRPGYNPNVIKLRFDNATELQMNSDGRLLIDTNGEEIIFSAPLAYQESGTRKEFVPSHFAKLGRSEIGFRVGQYDLNRELIIDPQLAYASFLGGEASDMAYDIALDGERNLYVTGHTWSSDFPTANPMDSTIGKNPGGDAFIAKYNSDGKVIFRTYLGGTFLDSGEGIAVDPVGNIYVVGTTVSSDFPLVDPLDSVKGVSEVFITKLSATGDQVLFSTFLGGSGNDRGKAIALGPDLSVYVTGATGSFSTGFPHVAFPLVNAEQTHFPGHEAAFIARLSPTLDQLVFSTYLSGTKQGAQPYTWDRANDIAVDSNGNAYIVGTAESTDAFQFSSVGPPPTAGYNGGLHDAFVAKYTAAGSRVFSIYLGGVGVDRGRGIDVDGDGDVYITGYTDSHDFPVTDGSFDPSCGADGFCGEKTLPFAQINPDAFVVKLDGLTAALIYSTFLGGIGDEEGRDIAVDDIGQAYVTGTTLAHPVSSPDNDFPVINPLPDQPVYGGFVDAFVTKFAPDGSELTFSTFLGGSGSDEGNAIVLDSGRNVYVVGLTPSIDFPVLNASQGIKAGPAMAKDAFIASILCAGEVADDLDSDGVCDEIEDDAPNGGDGNGDGIPDHEQNWVASLPNDVDSQFVTLVSSEGVLSGVKALKPMTKPAGVTFPVGAFHFTVEGLDQGGSTQVTLILPPNIQVNSYYKYGPTVNNPIATWYDFGFNGAVGANIAGNLVTLSLIDGQTGDHDMMANGEIIEPGGPVVDPNASQLAPPMPTATPLPPTATPEPAPTATPLPPTATPEPAPTATPLPPTATPEPEPTATPLPPTATPEPEPTETSPAPTATSGASPAEESKPVASCNPSSGGAASMGHIGLITAPLMLFGWRRLGRG